MRFNATFLGVMTVMGLLSGCSTTTLAVATGEWVLQQMESETVPSNVAANMTISADNTVAGFAGCNRFRGRFDEASKAVVGITSTRKACSPELMQWERRFLDALSHLTSVEREGEALSVKTDAGKVLVFRAVTDPQSGH